MRPSLEEALGGALSCCGPGPGAGRVTITIRARLPGGAVEQTVELLTATSPGGGLTSTTLVTNRRARVDEQVVQVEAGRQPFGYSVGRRGVNRARQFTGIGEFVARKAGHRDPDKMVLSPAGPP